jgi:histidine phosphotransferase ChpT
MRIALDLRISELLTARLCHELVGSITAVANGADFLCEAGLEVDQEALALIQESARRASSRLQFYRFAYGFSGHGRVTGLLPHELAAGFFATSQVTYRYPEDVRALSLVEQKLACNLLVFGSEALVRGGGSCGSCCGTQIAAGSRGRDPLPCRRAD